MRARRRGTRSDDDDRIGGVSAIGMEMKGGY